MNKDLFEEKICMSKNASPIYQGTKKMYYQSPQNYTLLTQKQQQK